MGDQLLQGVMERAARQNQKNKRNDHLLARLFERK
jgi:hypothetical protein